MATGKEIIAIGGTGAVLTVAAFFAGRYVLGGKYTEPPAAVKQTLQNLNYEWLYSQTDWPLREVHLDLDEIYTGEGLELTLGKWQPSVMPPEEPEKDVLISRKPDTKEGLRVVLIGDCQQQFRRAIENLRTNKHAIKIMPGSHRFPRHNYARSGRLPYPVYIGKDGRIYIDDFDFIRLADVSEYELGQLEPKIKHVKTGQEIPIYPEEPTEWGAQRLIDRIDGLNRGCISQYGNFAERVTKKAEQALYQGLKSSTQEMLNRSEQNTRNTLNRAECAARRNLMPRARSSLPNGGRGR